MSVGGVEAEHQGTRTLLWEASPRTAVARRGLAVRASDDGRAGIDDSSARRCRQPGKRRDAHVVARGTRRRGRLGLRSDRGAEPGRGRELSRPGHGGHGKHGRAQSKQAPEGE